MKFTLSILFLIILIVACSQETGIADPVEFKVVTVMRVDSINSNAAGNRYINWTQDGSEKGVLIILKSIKPVYRELYSTDFSLGYESKSGIPRRPCIGISMGQKAPENPKNWTWWLGGSVSRAWITKEKQYFGLIFAAPKATDSFELFDSIPIAKEISVGS